MGPIGEFLTADHARLDGLLERSRGNGKDVDREPFGGFREGLLRHIGMEETLLLPPLLKCPGAPVTLAGKLRLDHGALTNLLVPLPSLDILRAIEFILKRHNPLEEEPDGFYDACDRLLAAQSEDLIRKMRTAPEIPLRSYSKRPEALAAAKRALERAGYFWENCIRD